MGRPKSYDREDVAAKAMNLFWQRGFQATSTKDLADTMGINVYSLFAEFESKQGLYETALDLYFRDVVTGHFGILESPDAGLNEVISVIDFFAAASGKPGAEYGCFLCNMATERAPVDPNTQDMVENYVDRIQKAINNALKNSSARGELRPELSCEDESRLLTSTLLGFWVLMRSGVTPEHVTGAARAVRRNLELMRA
jgi:TetR/AcrR family transcriptional repressor of nem operon